MQTNNNTHAQHTNTLTAAEQLQAKVNAWTEERSGIAADKIIQGLTGQSEKGLRLRVPGGEHIVTEVFTRNSAGLAEVQVTSRRNADAGDGLLTVVQQREDFYHMVVYTLRSDGGRTVLARIGMDKTEDKGPSLAVGKARTGEEALENAELAQQVIDAVAAMADGVAAEKANTTSAEVHSRIAAVREQNNAPLNAAEATEMLRTAQKLAWEVNRTQTSTTFGAVHVKLGDTLVGIQKTADARHNSGYDRLEMRIIDEKTGKTEMTVHMNISDNSAMPRLGIAVAKDGGNASMNIATDMTGEINTEEVNNLGRENTPAQREMMRRTNEMLAAVCTELDTMAERSPEKGPRLLQKDAREAWAKVTGQDWTAHW